MSDNQFTSKGRGDYQIAPGLTMRDLYNLMYDRLNYCRINDSALGAKAVPLDELTDIDALCQQFVVMVEKKLGIYPNVGTRAEQSRDPMADLRTAFEGVALLSQSGGDERPTLIVRARTHEQRDAAAKALVRALGREPSD